MPKKKIDPELENEEIVEEEEVQEQGKEKEVVIDIGDEEEDDADEGEIEIDPDDKSGDAEKRKSNYKFAKRRVEDKEKKERQELRDQISSLSDTVGQLSQNMQAQRLPVVENETPDVGVPKTPEEWDALAEKDWRKAVDLRSETNARRIIKEAQTFSSNEKNLLESKQRVLARHPELNDNNSEKSKIFLQICQDNPDYLANSRGPVYAMRDMEDRMEMMGYKKEEIVSAEKAGAKRESDRLNRIALGSNKAREISSDTSKVVITADEMEFCKYHDIDPKEFARNKKRLSGGK